MHEGMWNMYAPAIAGAFFYPSQPARQRRRQAVLVSCSAKKNRTSPVRTAVRTLVATIPMARRMTEKRIVPRIPARSADRVEHWLQQRSALPILGLARISSPRNPTAMPKVTQRNGAVMVITAVICRKAAMIPMIRLDTTAAMVQLHLKLQLHSDIFSPPTTIYAAMQQDVRKSIVLLYQNKVSGESHYRVV